MKIAVLGTGDVGRQIATRLVGLGHEVRLGSRTRDNPAGLAWAAEAETGSLETFEGACRESEVVFLCVRGEHARAVLGAAGNLDGTVVVDVTNPLDFSSGFPPTLSVANTESLAEQLQEAFPAARIVKTLNTLSNPLMVDPRQLPDEHHIFLSGNDADAKAVVRRLLESFGWRPHEVLDLGDISTARGTEMWLPLWLRLYGVLGTPLFNIKLVRAT
ncbi:MAG: NAD(P)-binding domain-containing protein [Myxococcota bacterium]